MINRKDAEESLLAEMLDRHAERLETGDMTDRIVTPCANIEEIQARVERASALSFGSLYRVSQQFLEATAPTESSSPRYQDDLEINLTREELIAKIAAKGMTVSPGMSGKFGNIMVIKKPGAALLMGGIIILVSPDTGKLYSFSTQGKAQIEALMKE